MSDTSGLPNADGEGIPAEDQPERFENAQAAEPAETEPGQSGDDGADTPSSGDASSTGDAPATGTAPEGAEDVTDASTTGGEAAEPPPADFDPAQQPSNPDLVKNTEPPD